MKDYFLLKNDTITAISSPLGIGAISIIRISGNKTLEIINKIFISKNNKIYNNKINFGIIKYKNDIIDQVIVLFFKAPNSYTGEDIIEINCHGSIYIQNKIISIIIKYGARLAINGEFTYRAYINKKISLLQAESVLDTINSNNKLEHKQAINNLINNKLYYYLNKIEKIIINLLSYIEINLDFIEVELDNNNIYKNILLIKNKLKKLINSFKINNIIKKGVYITIIGPVNSGKSTLMNRIINENKSIVSNIPGTTRDIVEGMININNFNFYFYDTAGIRNTKSKIEKIGIKKTYNSIKNTNIIFFVFDYKLLNKKEKIYKIIKNKKKIIKNKTVLFIANKIDKNNYNNLYKKYKYLKINSRKYRIIYISAKKKIGLNKIKRELKNMLPNKILLNNYLINNVRHYKELKIIYKYIKKVEIDYKNNIQLELISIDIKNSLQHLYKITGKYYTNNNILNNIFKNFCIGK
ncbi:MAG: tRNA uridine-5-carboxymethylaminomethyl(34) synthesis GTPase MnmE [Candidatus Shikimatogenerans bostrichidophilus]|nr:MAG: tRNA uridine-5-carboxymethylaminomethyl(34) synthesis GTPase MnmE [Candidatus Shikimatogenerans bostrichidophilus]